MSIACLLAGCAARKRQQAAIDEMRVQLAELNRQSIEQRKALEDLNSKLFILHDRMETVRNQMARQPAQPAVKPPRATEPKLKVVRLKPEPATTKERVVPKLIESYDPDEDEAAFVPAPANVSEAVKAARQNPEGGASSDDSPEDPADLYQRAFDTLKRKEFGEAILQFDRFVKQFPNHDLADNALYWLGECYYGQGEHLLAIQEFRRVPELYPNGNKVPDALLKIGFAYAALGDDNAAKRTLKKLIDAYPGSEATRLAQVRLSELNKQSP